MKRKADMKEMADGQSAEVWGEVLAIEGSWEDLAMVELERKKLRLIARSRGGTVLFVGPEVAAKTLAAGLLAKRQSRILLRVDLGRVVRQYIGETEKQIDQLFSQAEKAGWVLLFDEADALFGKRTDVNDGHDRYANQEVGYLLGRLEPYRGLAIMTSNCRHESEVDWPVHFNYVVRFEGKAEEKTISRRGLRAVKPQAKKK